MEFERAVEVLAEECIAKFRRSVLTLQKEEVARRRAAEAEAAGALRARADRARGTLAVELAERASPAGIELL